MPCSTVLMYSLQMVVLQGEAEAIAVYSSISTLSIRCLESPALIVCNSFDRCPTHSQAGQGEGHPNPTPAPAHLDSQVDVVRRAGRAGRAGLLLPELLHGVPAGLDVREHRLQLAGELIPAPQQTP